MCLVSKIPFPKSIICSIIFAYLITSFHSGDGATCPSNPIEKRITIIVNEKIAATIWFFVNVEVRIPNAKSALPIKIVPRYPVKIGPKSIAGEYILRIITYINVVDHKNV